MAILVGVMAPQLIKSILRPTFDFRQRLLSFGSTVEVLKPESLREEMKEEIKAMLDKYRNDNE